MPVSTELHIALAIAFDKRRSNMPVVQADQQIQVRDDLDKWVPAVVEYPLSAQFTYLRDDETVARYMAYTSPDWRKT